MEFVSTSISDESKQICLQSCSSATPPNIPYRLSGVTRHSRAREQEQSSRDSVTQSSAALVSRHSENRKHISL